MSDMTQDRDTLRQTMLPATAHPRTCARYHKAACAPSHRVSAGKASLPNSAATTSGHRAVGPSQSSMVRSRSSRPTIQDPAVMARI